MESISVLGDERGFLTLATERAFQAALTSCIELYFLWRYASIVFLVAAGKENGSRSYVELWSEREAFVCNISERCMRGIWFGLV